MVYIIQGQGIARVLPWGVKKKLVKINQTADSVHAFASYDCDGFESGAQTYASSISIR